MRFCVSILAGILLSMLALSVSTARAQAVDVAGLFQDQVDNGPWGCARCSSDGGCGCGGMNSGYGAGCGCESDCGCEPACGAEVGCCETCCQKPCYAGMKWNQCGGLGAPRCRCYGPECSHQPSCGCGGCVGEPACGCNSGCGCGVECHNGIGHGVVRGLCSKLYGCLGGCSGCGCELYWSEWHNDPPRCCDPCDCCANWVGPSLPYRAPYAHSYGTGGGGYAGPATMSSQVQVANRKPAKPIKSSMRR